MSNEKEISIVEFISVAKRLVAYLVSKWVYIILVVLLFGILGIIYATYQKPIYTAEITFSPENENAGNMAYAGLAAQFGLNIGGNSQNAFGGNSLTQLMQSRHLIVKTLFTEVNVDERQQLLITYYLKATGLDKLLKKDTRFKGVDFTTENPRPYSRARDSLFKLITGSLGNAIKVSNDKSSDFISVKFQHPDEQFAKVFVEQLVHNVIDYYTDIKVQKTKRNVEILQRQTDSVRRLIRGNIEAIAVSNDLNVNPARQVLRTGVQKSQVDAEVNGALYTELVKSLEISRMSLRKETPLIQIIDPPMFPLEKTKIGRLKAAIIFGFIGFTCALVFFVIKRLLSKY